MRETRTIKLRKPLESPEGPVKQIVIREPTFDEYLVHGDPFTIASSSEGLPFVVENSEVIAKYIRLCLVEPKDPQILHQGTARVAREVKEALLGFFRQGEPEAEGSET